MALRPRLIWGPGDANLLPRLVERARAGRLPWVGDGAALVDSTYVDNARDALEIQGAFLEEKFGHG